MPRVIRAVTAAVSENRLHVSHALVKQRTAKALGVSIARPHVVRADRVIE